MEEQPTMWPSVTLAANLPPDLGFASFPRLPDFWSVRLTASQLPQGWVALRPLRGGAVDVAWGVVESARFGVLAVIAATIEILESRLRATPDLSVSVLSGVPQIAKVLSEIGVRQPQLQQQRAISNRGPMTTQYQWLLSATDVVDLVQALRDSHPVLNRLTCEVDDLGDLAAI